jgi:hypothetical protein
LDGSDSGRSEVAVGEELFERRLGARLLLRVAERYRHVERSEGVVDLWAKEKREILCFGLAELRYRGSCGGSRKW